MSEGNSFNNNMSVSYEEALEIVKKNANLFENGHETEISDYVFDGLLNLIKKVNPKFDWRADVVYETDGKEVKHTIDFRPFEKNYDIKDYSDPKIYKDLAKDYIITPKFDGSSIVVYLSGSKIINILSKGDKDWGFINTNKLKAKAEYALKHRLGIDAGPDLNTVKAVCCEAVCNKENGGRSKANGLINSKYCQDDVDAYLELMPWDVVFNDDTRSPNKAYELTYEEFMEICTTGLLTLAEGKIPCDGVVCYPRDGNPQLFIQKIYTLETPETTTNNVTWDPSDYGLYHPVAEFDTVVFENDGKECSRVNMSNIDLLHDRKIAVGTKITVGLAGSTIPAYMETISAPDNFEEYYKQDEDGCYENIRCTECGAKLKRCGDSSDLICSNHDCGWWYRTFKYRLLQNVLGEEFTDEIQATIMMEKPEDTATLNVIKQEKGIKDWRDYVEDNVDHYFNMVQIQRVSDAKWDLITHGWADNIENKENKTPFMVMGAYLSDKQYDYMEEVNKKLEKFLDHIS